MTITDEEVHVLHVDDDEAFADMAATFLEREDERIDVRTATSADEAEAILARDDGEVDCIVSDHDMPGRTGVELLEAVRTDRPDLPFVLYTGKGSEAIASDAISAGVTDYLQKKSGTDQYTVLANRITNAVESYRSQRALAERNRELMQYERMINSMGEAACIYDADGRYVIVNEHLAEWYGETRAALEGRTSNLIPVIEAQSDADDPYRALFDGRCERLDGEVESEFPGHGHAVLEYRLTPLTVDGVVEGVVGVARDITDRKERKRELERYEAYLQESTDIITVLDESGTIEYGSPSITRILGYEPGEIVGENGFEFIHPDDVDDLYAKFSALITDPGATVTAECRFRTADDEWCWLEVRGTNQLDHDAIGSIVTNNRDITDRKERERELERRTEELQALATELEEQYEYLFEEAPVMAVVTRAEDGEPIIEDCNQLFVGTLGYEKSDVIGRNLGEFYTDDSRRAMTEGGYERALEGEFMREDRDLVTAGGDVVASLLRAVPRYDGRDEATGTLALYVDISARRDLERQKSRLEEFTSVVSHDLRNPLNVAQNRVELAREECDSEHLDAVLKAHERMSTLIEDLLSLARSGTDVGETEAVGLPPLADRCWRTVATGEASLSVTVDRPIRADRNRLRQLLENLMRNSIEHGGDDVTVTLGPLPDGFYVEDDGVGIPAAEREAVFDVGYSSDSEGTGFGLSIVERIAQAHGWTVRVTDGPDGGARFEFTDVGLVED
ncbi:PAS domain S-box protein [Haloplanus salilacus]|uniref:PAS domain S-box protein n=1 Tax=Haloplanus salilacus TaxID=2949994 RepID=UPI0030CC413D